MWSADQLLAMEYEMARERQALAGIPTGKERKAYLLQVVKRSIGSFESHPEHTPVLLEETDCGAYIRKRVELSATPGLMFAAYILIPKHPSGRKLPGVIAAYGHGYGSRQILGMHPDGTPDEAEPGIYKNFALELVKRGMIVVAPDVVRI